MDINKNDVAVRTEVSDPVGASESTEVHQMNIVGKLVTALKSVDGKRFPYYRDRAIPQGKWRPADMRETAAYIAGARHVSEVDSFLGPVTASSQSTGRDDRGRFSKKEEARPGPFFKVGDYVTYLDHKICTSSAGDFGRLHFGGGSDAMTGFQDTVKRVGSYIPEKGCYKIHTEKKGYAMIECEFEE